MSIGTICYPAMSKPEPDENGSTISKSSDFDSRDIAIYCLSGAVILLVIALIVLVATRPQVARSVATFATVAI